MTPIVTAAAEGYSEEEILDFIKKYFPKMGPQIKKAALAGYNPFQILKFLNSEMEQKTFSPTATSHEIQAGHNEKLNKIAKRLYGTAATAVAGAGILKSMPPLVRNLLGATTSLGADSENSTTGVQNTSTTVGQNIGPQGQGLLNQSGLSSSQPVSPNMHQQAQPQVQQGIQGQPSPRNVQTSSSQTPLQQNLNNSPSPSGIPPKEKATAIINKLGIEEHINKSNKPGKKFETIVSDVIKSLTPQQKEEYQKLSRSAQIPPMAQLVKDYLSNESLNMQNSSVQDQNQPENGQISDFPIPIVKPEIGNRKEEQKPIEEKPLKGSIASTPDGMVGEIKELRNGKALIESGGKLHQVKESDLQGSPISEKDLAELYDDMLRGIEKHTGEEVSRNVEWAGYDPEANELFYKPHLGQGYTYKDISEEDVKLLTGILNTRKSTGENFIGAWQKGSKSPIGAAMSALIRKLQAQHGKGKEYSRKYQTVYAAHEPAQQALKKKKKNEKRLS